MAKSSNKVALIGLGKMGAALAKRLLGAQFDLIVYNRTESKIAPFLELGAKAATTPKEAAAKADVIVTSLFDDHSVLEVMAGENGLLAGMKPGSIHIGTSTILPATSKKLTELHAERQTDYVAGNVLGVPKVAEEGELTSIVAGKANLIHACESIFKAYSSNIINVGEEAYKANVMKICMNYFLITSIECMGELYTFAEKNNLDLEYIQKMFQHVFAHPAYKLYAEKIKDRNFDEVNFDLKGGFKDIQLFQQAFIDVQVVPDIATIIRNKFITALALGMEQKDWCAVTDISRLLAGLK